MARTKKQNEQRKAKVDLKVRERRKAEAEEMLAICAGPHIPGFVPTYALHLAGKRAHTSWEAYALAQMYRECMWKLGYKCSPRNTQ